MSKLILTNEVDGLGSAGDVVEVQRRVEPRNYLIPQGYAVAWTRGGEKQVASIRAARDARAIATHDEAASLKAKLEAGKVKLSRKAGCRGASVRFRGAPRMSPRRIAAAGLGELDKRRITLPSAIKSTGDHEAVVRLLDDVVATIPLQVVAPQEVERPSALKRRGSRRIRAVFCAIALRLLGISVHKGLWRVFSVLSTFNRSF